MEKAIFDKNGNITYKFICQNNGLAYYLSPRDYLTFVSSQKLFIESQHDLKQLFLNNESIECYKYKLLSKLNQFKDPVMTVSVDTVSQFWKYLDMNEARVEISKEAYLYDDKYERNPYKVYKKEDDNYIYYCENYEGKIRIFELKELISTIEYVTQQEFDIIKLLKTGEYLQEKLWNI